MIFISILFVFDRILPGTSEAHIYYIDNCNGECCDIENPEIRKDNARICKRILQCTTELKPCERKPCEIRTRYRWMEELVKYRCQIINNGAKAVMQYAIGL